MEQAAAGQARAPRIVILGAGFGGLAAAQELGGAPAQVTVVDRRNHHLFIPLLYQVATGALSPAEIAEPIRHLLRRHRNVEVVLGDVAGIDTAARKVRLEDGGELPYDRLVVATGSRSSWFGHPEWREHAPALRSLEDARRIRSRLLLAFEQAERERDAEERRRLLTFVVVGGGATGVELAGAVIELARRALKREFRHIDPAAARVFLLEAGDRLLPSMPRELSDYARRALERLGVEVRLKAAVESVDAAGVTVAGERQPAACVLWGAGVAASPAAEWLGVEAAKGGKVEVEESLAVPGLQDVFVIGDAAACPGPDGTPLPGLAQVAKQQGRHLGRELRHHLPDGLPPAPFRFRNRGDMATIGRHAAVADFDGRTLRGRPAWLLWGLVHVYLLVGFQNRLLVTLRWLAAWATNRFGARLITLEEAPGDRSDAGRAEQA
ncbi:MAG: NAD(P)/FAD-dependent oxidoreductase [Tistlia sp.]|uniref:NAD(P)/FAD-dependent oxidoreductase n=1 Tax=Tistlia sp. TaxID=3057121 RepID=UPI0034A321AE